MGENRNIRASIGCDPEFFLVDKNGNVISAIEKIPGSKHNPHILNSSAGLQTDNVAVEFASAVATSGDELVRNLRETLGEIAEMLPADTSLAAMPSAIFPDAELEHPQAKEFGCSPDYNAWSLVQNEVPEDINKNFRSCGGHLHVGHVEGDGNEFLEDFDGKIAIVKAMDCFHGIVSTVLDNSPEAIERRKLYGAAGCHRPTDYGIEYRVLSNYWLKSPQLVMLQDALIQDCLKIVREDKLAELVNSIGEDKVESIINDGKVDEAKTIIEVHLTPLMSVDSKHYLDECCANIEKYDFKTAWAV